jgi:hypothetical protein
VLITPFYVNYNLIYECFRNCMFAKNCAFLHFHRAISEKLLHIKLWKFAVFSTSRGTLSLPSMNKIGDGRVFSFVHLTHDVIGCLSVLATVHCQYSLHRSWSLLSSVSFIGACRWAVLFTCFGKMVKCNSWEEVYSRKRNTVIANDYQESLFVKRCCLVSLLCKQKKKIEGFFLSFKGYLELFVVLQDFEIFMFVFRDFYVHPGRNFAES